MTLSSVRYGYSRSHTGSEVEASKEVSQVSQDTQVLSSTEATAEVKSRRHRRKKARKVEKDSDRQVSQSDTSADKKKVERTRSRSRSPSVTLRMTEAQEPSPQTTSAPTVLFACVTAAMCTTTTVTMVSTPISSTGTRPPYYGASGTGQQSEFVQPQSALGTGSTDPVQDQSLYQDTDLNNDSQTSHLSTHGGVVPKKPLYKVCQKCHHGRTLSVADSHQFCINCLGPDHAMVNCEACNKLPNKALIERARRLIWWRSRNLPACPSAKLIREILVRIAGMPEILDDTHVARRILEIGGVTLQPMAQPIPPVSEPEQLIPLHSHVDEEVTEEIIPVGI